MTGFVGTGSREENAPKQKTLVLRKPFSAFAIYLLHNATDIFNMKAKTGVS
jgi:hypothetical protein